MVWNRADELAAEMAASMDSERVAQMDKKMAGMKVAMTVDGMADHWDANKVVESAVI